MAEQRHVGLAWGVWGAWTVLFVAAVALQGQDRPPLLALPAWIAYPTLGAYLAARRPRHPLGWLLLAAALFAAAAALAFAYGALPRPVVGSRPGARGALAAAGALGEVASAVIGFVFLLFPDGRLPSRRWRPVAWALAATFACQALLTATATANGAYTRHVPLGVTAAHYYYNAAGPALAWVTLGSFVLSRLLVVAAASSLLVRLRAAHGEQRQQLKWVTYAAVPFALVSLLHLVAPDRQRFYDVADPLVIATLVAAVVVAVLKHRLYAIDAIVSRTLVYTTLAVLVTAVYVTLVVGIGSLLPNGSDRALGSSIVATAVVALGFAPARDRLQRWANALVFGRRLSPYDAMADFARRMAGAYSLEEVLPRLAEAAARGVGAAVVRVRVWLPEGGERSVCWPPAAVAETFDAVLGVAHRGDPVGEIAVAKPRGERLARVERKVLADLAAQAGPVLRNVALVVELEDRVQLISQQAAELRASRQRLVSAQDAERRRIERDLHDGAQQHLVSLAGQLRLLQRIAVTDPARAQPLVDRLVAEADDTLEVVRDLARGIFPLVLGDKGLAAALRARMGKHHPHAWLDCDPVLEDRRLDPRVEAAVYFCCLEALQNAAKHAPGAGVGVRLVRDGKQLVFIVSDDGPGFEPQRARGGTGLANMADRLSALGGTLRVDATPGRGTTVIGGVAVQPDALDASRPDRDTPTASPLV
jgi:signal transduction histidine kinase